MSKPKAKKEPVLDTGTFYQAPVKVGRTSVTIELPIKVAQYFDLDGPVVYWAPIGGVIQLSGKQPNMVIPMMCGNTTEFMPQHAAADAKQAAAAATNPARVARRRNQQLEDILDWIATEDDNNNA